MHADDRFCEFLLTGDMNCQEMVCTLCDIIPYFNFHFRKESSHHFGSIHVSGRSGDVKHQLNPSHPSGLYPPAYTSSASHLFESDMYLESSGLPWASF